MIRSSKQLTDALPAQLNSLETALELATGDFDQTQLTEAQAIIDKANERLKHGTANTLVALLGATGSGKSSLSNALTGSGVATVGVRRPTTSSTLGCYWPTDQADDRSANALLDWLEIKNRHQVIEHGDQTHPLGGLVLLDVPDHDSIAVEHRMEMERIAQHVDLLIWVTDSEKYADKAMHDYLSKLAEHGAVTAVLFNKIDLLSATEQKACISDLKQLLKQKQLNAVPVIAVSASSGDGLERLNTFIAEVIAKQRAMLERLSADTRRAAKALLRDIGPIGGMETLQNRSGDKIAKTLAKELVGASGLEAVCEAVAAGHRRDAAGYLGWPFTRWLRQLLPHPLRRLHLGQGSAGKTSLPEPSGMQRARSQAANLNATSAVSADMADPWPKLITKAGTPDSVELNNRIEDVIATSVRSINPRRKPLWWKLINTLQIVLAVIMILGALWLGLLAVNAYLRLPEIPYPKYREIPYPTLMLAGGIIAGLLLSAIARPIAAQGAKRLAARVHKKAATEVRGVSDELIMQPMQAQLERRNRLRQALSSAYEP